MRLLASLMMPIVLVSASMPALAQGAANAEGTSGTDKARAQELFREGQALYTEEKYAEALQRFEAAIAAMPVPGLYYNIAQCHRKLGNHEQAIAALEHFRQEQKNIPAKMKRDVKTQIAEQKKALVAKNKAQAKADALAAKEEKARAEKEKALALVLPPVAPAPLPMPVPAAKPIDWTRSGKESSETASTTPPAQANAGSRSSDTRSDTRSDTGSVTASATPAAAQATPQTSKDPAADGGEEDKPIWQRPLFLGAAAGTAVLVAAAGTGMFLLAQSAPGPKPPETSLGTTDLR
jgi:hypothetical protein